MQILKSQFIDLETYKFVVDFTDFKVGTSFQYMLPLKHHPKGFQIMWSQLKLNQVFAGTGLVSATVALGEEFTNPLPNNLQLAFNSINGFTAVGEYYGSTLAAPRRVDTSIVPNQPLTNPLLLISKMAVKFVGNAAFNLQNLTAGNLTIWYTGFRAT